MNMGLVKHHSIQEDEYENEYENECTRMNVRERNKLKQNFIRKDFMLRVYVCLIILRQHPNTDQLNN